jgi:hypothetical protein
VTRLEYENYIINSGINISDLELKVPESAVIMEV